MNPLNISCFVSACTGRGPKIASSGPSATPTWLLARITAPFLRQLLAVEHPHLDPAADHEARERAQRVEQVARRVPTGTRRQLAGSSWGGHASLRTAPTRATTWSITSSREYAVVSMCTAPSAITSGETVRPVSIWSRASSDSRVALDVGAALLGGAAGRPRGRLGGEVDLDRRLRPDHRADVAALDHDPGSGQRRVDGGALDAQQPGPHLRDGAHRGDRGVDVGLPDRGRDVLAVHRDGRARAGRCRSRAVAPRSARPPRTRRARRRRGAASTRSSRGTSRRCRGSGARAGRPPRERCWTCRIRRCRRPRPRCPGTPLLTTDQPTGG